jgi:hypothetical protein
MGLQIRPIVNKNIPQMWSIIVICCDSIFLKKYKVKDYKKNHLRFWPFLWNNTQSMGEIIYVIMPKVRYLICWPWHVTIATWRRFKQLIRPNELQIIFVYICWCAILAWWGAIVVGGYTTTCKLASITTKVVSSNPVHDEVYSIQH